MIEFEKVNKHYGRTHILKDLTFTVPEGKFAVLIGPSGCGKTTTLKAINHLITPDSGAIRINGEDTRDTDKIQLRRHIGYVIQEIGLFPNMTVAENICVVPRLLKYDRAKCENLVKELLELVNMSSFADKYPDEMSGGQQQRVGVLRALAASPPIVLMDEPFGALDPMTRSALQDEIRGIQQKLRKTIVFVTHDMNEALKLADIIIFMDEGRIVQMASPEEMLRNPANDLVKSFLGMRVSGAAKRTKVEDFMLTNVYCASMEKGVMECAEMMARNRVDSIVVIDGNNKYAGTVSIADLRHWGRELKTIEPIVRRTARTVTVGDEAKVSFDYILEHKASYVIVLNEDDSVAGIVTKTSVARSVADNLWGD